MTAVDSWSDDRWVIPKGTTPTGSYYPQSDPAVDLPRALAELRDGIAVDPPTAGAARARRIEQMQHDIALCADFVADCDRYRDALNQYPNPCLTPLIGRLMGRHLADLRRHAVATGARLRDELTILRGGT